MIRNVCVLFVTSNETKKIIEDFRVERPPEFCGSTSFVSTQIRKLIDKTKEISSLME